MDAALDVVRRLPPHEVQDTLEGLLTLAPDLADELLDRVDQPLVERVDTFEGSGGSGGGKGGKPFLCCDFNRDGDAFRSHHSNQYFPADAAKELEDGGVKPSDRLRSLEVAANSVWRMYVEQYYEGGMAAVYCWDTKDDEGDTAAAAKDSDGFAACFLVKKDGSKDGRRGVLDSGYWDAIHVMDVGDLTGKGEARYQLTSTVMLSLESRLSGSGDGGSFQVGGSITRSSEQVCAIERGGGRRLESSHIANMGRMIEEMEGKLRSTLELVYFGKTREVVAALREHEGVAALSHVAAGKGQQMDLVAEMKRRASAVQQ